jgi:hypothetical protein
MAVGTSRTTVNNLGVAAVAKYSADAAPRPPQAEVIAEAYHGWFREGATSLWDRVTLGASTPVEGELKEASHVEKSASSSAATTDTVYEQRNELIKKAAVAGKSRWGDEEIVKVGGSAQPIVLHTGENPASPLPTVEMIKEADHGWFRDGMTSLSDRVTLGASTPVMEKGSASAATTSETSLYAKRNAKIAEMANSGKSRWGTAEVSKVQTLMASAGINGATATTAAAVAVPTTPVSHSNRVNLGVAAVTGGTAATTEDKDSSTSTSLYAKRNAKIAEIAHSGKSRWGTAEVSKVHTLVAGAGVNVMAPTVEEHIPSVASVVKAAPSKPSVSVNQGGGNFFSDSTAYRNCGPPKTNRKRPRTPRYN